MRSSRVLLALAPLALASPAVAQGTPEQRAACGPDAVRLCASSIPNVAKVSACLTEKRESLSAACRTVMDEAGAAGQPQVAETQPAGPASSADTASAKPGTELAKREQAASTSTPAPLRFNPRERQADNAARSPRRHGASRRHGTQHDRDVAEAVYWLRRVTGYSGTVNLRAFERVSQGDFSAIVR